MSDIAGNYSNRDQEELAQECLWCKQRIPLGAGACPCCNRSISKGKQVFRSWIVLMLVSVLTVFLVWYATSQVEGVRKERPSAADAATGAKDAPCSTIDTGLETSDPIRGDVDDPAGKMKAAGSPEDGKKLEESEVNVKHKRQELSCPAP